MVLAAAAAALVLLGGLLLWAWRRRQRLGRRSESRGRREAAARARLRSELLAQVSHEVRTPLNALMGAAELLTATPLNDGQRRSVQLIGGAGRELMQMLDDMLDLSNAEAGLLTLQRRPFSLTRVVAEQIALVGPAAAQKGLVLDTDTDAELPEAVVGDARRVAQVLRSLLTQALHHTAVGRITLAIGFGRDREHVRFEVRDTGAGIPADQLARLFTPDESIRPGALPEGGRGLRLTVARRLVALMGGRIGAHSREGLGSVVTFELPLPATAADPQGPEHLVTRARAETDPLPLGAHGVAGLRVLVAEGHALNLTLLRAFLEGAGHVVDAVPDGVAALRQFERQVYQVVLLDLDMPVTGGLAAVKAMRAVESRRGRTPARIVALGSEAGASPAAAAQAAGFDAHLARPYTRDQLLAAVAGGGMVARLSATAPGVLPSAANSLWSEVLSRLPDSNLPEAVERLGSGALYDRVLEAARAPLQGFEDAIAAALDGVPCDLDAAHRLARELRSLAATIGLPGLAADARRLERALHETVAPGHDVAVRAARERVLARLRPLCDALRVPPRPGPAARDAGPAPVAAGGARAAAERRAGPW